MGIKPKIKLISIFSIFPVFPIILIIVSVIFCVLGYFGVIDKKGRINHIANEIISNQTGFPLDEIEELEGIK